MAILSAGPYGDIIIYDEAVDAPLAVEGEGAPGDALVIQASGGLVRPTTPGGGGSLGDVSRAGATVNNRIARWHNTTPEIQNTGVTIDDSENISGYGTLTGGSSTVQLTDAAGFLRILGIGQNGAADRQAMLWDSGAGNWIVSDILEPGMVDISADTNLAATSPIVLTDDTLSHAVSGAIGGTYTSLTVDTLGHVTGATNPGHVLGAGSGTNNTVAKWTPDGNTIGNSDITDDDIGVTVVTQDFAVALGDVLVTAGDFRVAVGDSGFGRVPVASVRVAIQENNTQTSDMLRLIQIGAGDASIGFVAVGGTGTDWILGTDGTNGSFALGLGVGGVDDFPAFIVDASRNFSIVVGDFDVLNGDASINGILTLPKASGNGIKVDIASPTFGWADIIGDQFSKNTGATRPTLTAYNGVVQGWQFAVSDEAFMSFHMPHDYVKGTDIFLHIHWSHTSTLVTGGTITFKITSIYAKGHNQASFTTGPAIGTFVGSASTTIYRHIITEAQFSASTPTGIQVDTDLLEPDGIIEVTFEVDANNITVSSGGVPDPFIHFVDIHYQTSGVMGTKDKAPDFYA